MTVVVMFLCGGFIGRRGFSAEGLSDLLPVVIATYAAVVLLSLFGNLGADEIASLVGFATAGVLASAGGSLLLKKRFPPRASSSGA